MRAGHEATAAGGERKLILPARTATLTGIEARTCSAAYGPEA